MGNPILFAAAILCIAATVQAGPLARPAAPKLLPQGQIAADFAFDNAVRQTVDLPTAALRASRRQMIGGHRVSTADLRALADAGDSLAAYRFAKLLADMDRPDTTGAAAHYYAIAAYSGRAFAVPPLARLLRDEGVTYSESRLRNGLNAMTVQAQSGNVVAAELLGRMYLDGIPFGRDLAAAQRFFDMAGTGGSPRAVLQLGLALLSDPQDAAEGHRRARSALMQAARSADFSVRVTAENLLRQMDTPPIAEPAGAP